MLALKHIQTRHENVIYVFTQSEMKLILIIQRIIVLAINQINFAAWCVIAYGNYETYQLHLLRKHIDRSLKISSLRGDGEIVE